MPPFPSSKIARVANAMHVFTYGSLMFPTVWTRVVRGDYRARDAFIHGFRRLRIPDKEHPALVVSACAAPIMGRLYFDVNARDLVRLDHFETANYARVAIAATITDRACSAQAYLSLNLDSILNEDWNTADFERRGLSVFLSTYAVQNAPPG